MTVLAPHACHNMGVDPQLALQAAIKDSPSIVVILLGGRPLTIEPLSCSVGGSDEQLHNQTQTALIGLYGTFL